jgi:hypothetical protein
MWPMSALRAFREKRERDAKARERDQMFEALRETVEADNRMARGHVLCELCKHADDPLVPMVLTATLDKIAKRDLDDAMGVAIYSMNCMNNADLQSTVAEKTFDLAAQVDRKNAKQMAGVAMAANLIAANAEEGSDQQRRAQRLWHEAVDTLSATSSGIQYAFAAASNAALGYRKEYPLRDEAVNTWAELVTKLAQTDKAAAIEEARRVAGGYDAFGDEARAFRKTASEALKRFTH